MRPDGESNPDIGHGGRGLYRRARLWPIADTTGVWSTPPQIHGAQDLDPEIARIRNNKREAALAISSLPLGFPTARISKRFIGLPKSVHQAWCCIAHAQQCVSPPHFNARGGQGTAVGPRRDGSSPHHASNKSWHAR